MKNTILMLSFLFFSFPVLAVEQIECSTGFIEGFAEAAMELIDETEIKDAMDDAKVWLDKYKQTTDFEVKGAEELITRLGPVITDIKIDKGRRSQASLLASGINGRLADKKKSSAYGKKALDGIKLAFKIDRTNKNAGNAYAQSIWGMIDKGRLARPFIEGSMGIELDDEAKAAVKLLEDQGQTNHKFYKKLKDF